jgi:NTP pyrophosphatase (non-canonical NTP hydrolase)
MTEKIIAAHKQMVTDLVKPGAEILASLTAEKCNLIHMIWGITGEHLEILQALCGLGPTPQGDNMENLIEELGDSEFFLEGMMQQFGWNYEDVICHATKDLKFEFQDMVNAVEMASDLLKKNLMYGKSLDHDKLKGALGNILMCNLEVMKIAGVTREQALEANMEKLLKGRYKSGTYSDAQAIDRADKDHEECDDQGCPKHYAGSQSVDKDV